MADLSAAPQDAERAVLPRDVAVFLPLFAIALHKITAYPKGHPLRNTAVDSAALRLQAVLVNRPMFLLGVARGQLLTEGLATDPDNPLLRELANRLHRHQIGAVKFTPGVTREELVGVMELMSGDPRTAPAGQMPREALDQWEHTRLLPPAYDKLELSDDEQHLGDQLASDTTLSRLWIGLAAAAVAEEGAPELHADPRAMARAMGQGLKSPEQAKQVVNYLLGLSRELRLGHSAETAQIKERLATLLNHVGEDVLRELVSLGADLQQRRRLVADAAMVLPAGATLMLLRAVSQASHQTIAHSMLRMLSKLALQADRGAAHIREDADLAMREAVRQLVDRWTVEDPNPAPYTRVLERLSRHPATIAKSAELPPTESIRVIRMSLETDTVGDTVWAALEEAVSEGLAGEVVELLHDERVAPDIRDHFWVHLATPAVMRILLNNEPRDTDVVEQLLDGMGMAAAAPMLESLEVADNRTVRRRLLTRLERLGPQLGPMLVERLAGSPWYVQRNLLALLGSLPEFPAEFVPETYAAHDDPRVRREALKVMLRSPPHRDTAIVSALGDDDDAIVNLGLTSALEGCPPAAAVRVRLLLNDRTLALQLRLLAIRVLGTIRTPLTRDWMVDQALTRGSWLRRRRLVARSPELMVVIGCLARGFARDPAAQQVLRLAAESGDPEIRNAAAGGAGPEAAG